MLAAVHADRSGRIVVARDWTAAASDGRSVRPLGRAIPLPPGTVLEPLVDRVAVGLDRSGSARPLGAARWAVGAVLPPGHIRLAHPAHAAADRLIARPLAAVGADERGDVVVAAERIDPDDSVPARAEGALTSLVAAGLRERPSNRLVRQLARCARDYRCRAAANAFDARGDMAVPVAAPANEVSPMGVDVRARPDANPTEAAAFTPSDVEIADVAASHLEHGGALVAFGRACEGEPLLAARTIDAAIALIRTRTTIGQIHLETNGSLPASLKRLARAGLDSVAIRVASARAETYERVHGPKGFRFADVRASIDAAADEQLALAILLLVMPGLTDLAAELDAIVALCGALPGGSQVLLRDLAADPAAIAPLVSGGDPLGIPTVLERLRSDLPELRVATTVRPLARV